MNRVEWARILLTYRDDPSFFAVPTLKARIETLEAEMTLSGARSDRGGRWPGWPWWRRLRPNRVVECVGDQ
jgi:hypothetical protein